MICFSPPGTEAGRELAGNIGLSPLLVMIDPVKHWWNDA